MFNVFDIARAITSVGWDPATPAESVLVCPLRLQKLLYYSQGWSLALLDMLLFADPIEAWANGPVVPPVYQPFKGSKCALLPTQIPDGTGEHLPEPVSDLIHMVWSRYAGYTPGELIRMTHSERPWLAAREGVPPGERSNNEIDTHIMKEYFSGEARREARHLDPMSDWSVDTGRGRPAGDVFAELLKRAG